jgi:hypothetical protein
MPTTVTSRGDGKMKGAARKNGSGKMIADEMTSDVVKSKIGSARRSAVVWKRGIVLMRSDAWRPSETRSAWPGTVLCRRREGAKRKNSATEIAGLIARRCRTLAQLRRLHPPELLM